MDLAQGGHLCRKCGYFDSNDGMATRTAKDSVPSRTQPSCGHEGACGCVVADALVSENNQLLQMYGSFLTEEQFCQLTPCIDGKQSVKPFLTKWGVMQMEPMVIPLFYREYVPCEEPASFTSAVLFVEANGGVKQNHENLSDAENDWYETLCSLLTNLIEQGVSPNKNIFDCIGLLLQGYGFMYSCTPLPDLICSMAEFQATIAVTNEAATYFHGIVVRGGEILYFIPDSGAYKITFALLEELLKELKSGGNSIHIYQKVNSEKN